MRAASLMLVMVLAAPAVRLHAQSVTLPASALRGSVIPPRGFHLGAAFGAATLDFRDGSANDYQGLPALGFRLGWGFGPRFGVQASAEGSGSEGPGGGGFAHLELVGRYNYLGQRRWSPYLEAAVGRRSVNLRSYEHPVTGESAWLRASGPAYSLGVGAQWLLSASSTIELGLRTTAGNFTSVRFDDARAGNEVVPGAWSTRLLVGSSWYPMAARSRR